MTNSSSVSRKAPGSWPYPAEVGKSGDGAWGQVRLQWPSTIARWGDKSIDPLARCKPRKGVTIVGRKCRFVRGHIPPVVAMDPKRNS